jgi:hypothetical protein
MKESYDNIKEIVVGFELEKGKTVSHVFNRTDDYVIFEIKETGQITYRTTPSFPDNAYQIALLLDKVEYYLDDSIGKYYIWNKLVSHKNLWNEYRNTMADVYFLCLDAKQGNVETAKGLLNSIAPELDENTYSRSKIYYLIPCALAVLMAVIISLCCKRHAIYLDHESKHMIYMITFGGIGGLFSVAINIDKHHEKVNRLIGAHVLAGTFRMLIAMMSGLIMYVFFKSKLIAIGNSIASGDASFDHFAYYMVAIVAGFSQTLVPNLIRKTDTKVDDTDKG